MHKFISIVAVATLAGIATAQLPGVSGIRVKVGYGWSGRITDINNNSRHLTGPILGVEFPLMKLPLVQVGLTGEALLGGQLSRGSDLDGNVYRLMLSGRASIPGSQLGVFGGLGWGFAQARGGEFGNFDAEVAQLGVSFPLGINAPLISPSLELAGTWSSKTGLGGFSASVAVRF